MSSIRSSTLLTVLVLLFSFFGLHECVPSSLLVQILDQMLSLDDTDGMTSTTIPVTTTSQPPATPCSNDHSALRVRGSVVVLSRDLGVVDETRYRQSLAALPIKRAEGEDIGLIWQTACKQEHHYGMLETATDARNNVVEVWQPDAGSDQSAQQRFHTITCSQESVPCQGAHPRYESKCEQKFALVRVRIRSSTRSGGFYQGNITIPVSCDCMLRYQQDKTLLRQVFGLK